MKPLKSNHIWVPAGWQDAGVLDYLGKMCVESKDSPPYLPAVSRGSHFR